MEFHATTCNCSLIILGAILCNNIQFCAIKLNVMQSRALVCNFVAAGHGFSDIAIFLIKKLYVVR